MTVLAIDQGTSATKALVIDGDRILATAEVPVDVDSSSDGGVEVDAEVLWDSVVAAGTTALARAGSPRVDAIGLANQGETVLAWDRHSGRPASRCIVWQDRRSSVVCDRLRDHAARVAHLTGLTLDPYFVAPKAVWLRHQLGDEDALDGASLAITTTDVWLLHRLCGAFVTDVATAGRTLLLDLDRGEWSHEACAIFGIDPESLPTIVANAAEFGTTTAFGGEIPVTGACVDQQAALFAQRCHTAGEAKCTYGTGAFLQACTGASPVRSATGLAGCPAWRLGEELTWCLDGQVYTAGATIAWLRSMGVLDDPVDLDRVAGAVDDAHGVTFVPALAGLAAPWWKPLAKAAITGVTLATERGHVVRAAIDGIATQIALLARAAADDLGTPLSRLRVDGGLARSATLLQVQADLLQAPVEVHPTPHATAEGIAAFATIGMGAALAPEPPAGTRTVFEPRIGAAEADERLARWCAVAEATMDR